MPLKPTPFVGRKLLVAALGVATITYVGVVACGGATEGGETSTYPPSPGDLPSPPPTSGNLVGPPPRDASADADAAADRGDGGDAADADAGGDPG